MRGIPRGQFVTFTAEELKALDVESSKVIDLDKFVSRNEIDPVFFDSPYYVYPDGPIAVETLRVIGAAWPRPGLSGSGVSHSADVSGWSWSSHLVPEWRCSRSGLPPKFGRHNLAAPRATSMPKWWQLPM
jgi:hypothetical protein